jgi:uncharacterized membrane protein YphA (DoxX/SURF4 family)
MLAIPKSNNNDVAWNIILLILRIWFGYFLMKNGRVFFQILTSADQRKFFEYWFGKELHFPLPVVMGCLAKGSEFFGGLFVMFGLFTRVFAFLASFTMLVATITANSGAGWDPYGMLTLSFCLFGIIFVYWGAGRYAIDALIKKRNPAL